jgi:signal transduction histidine kinase
LQRFHYYLNNTILITEFQEGERLYEDMLAEMGNLLHTTMLKATMVFGIGFGILNIFIGTKTESFLAFILIPICAFFLWLFAKGYKILSKVLSLLIISLILCLVSLLVSPDVLSPLFFIPILMGTQIVFPGREYKIGYAMLGIILLMLVVVLMGGEKILLINPALKSPEKIYLDRISNILGTVFLCLIEIFYVMRVGKKIQTLLAERSEGLRQSNKRLTSLVHSRESMVSILSHDLRSPLTLIVSTLDLLKPGRFSPDQLEGLLDKVGNRTKNTLLMLDSLLLWSRSHLEGTAYEPELVSSGQIRKSIQDYCDLLSTEKAIPCEILIPVEKQFKVNRIMLETILRNLISNAFKFTPVKGKIQVSATEEAESWIFRVSDTGKGMSAEALQNLRNGMSFSTEGTDREKGHGLGIQIVRDFVQRLNAGFEIESEPGKGTSFSIRIPVSQPKQ